MRQRLPKLLLGAAIITAVGWFATREATSPKKLPAAEFKQSTQHTSPVLARDVAAENREVSVVAAAAREGRTEMMRVEDFRNCGRATPSDAFQTLIWAAIVGDDDELAATVVFGDGARELAEAWRVALPAEAQANYTIAEKLPGLFLTAAILPKSAAIEILETIELPPDQVRLRVRTVSLDGTVGISVCPMRRGDRGWGIEMPAEMVSAMRKSPFNGLSDRPNQSSQPSPRRG